MKVHKPDAPAPEMVKLYNITTEHQPVVPVVGPARTVPPGEYIELAEHEAKDLAASHPDRFALKLTKLTLGKEK